MAVNLIIEGTATDPSGVTSSFSGTIELKSDAPVVSGQTAQLDLLLANVSDPVATMQASNSPTGWSIVGGDPNAYFHIDSSGVVRCTVAGELGLVPGTVTLTVRATNAAGTGDGTLSLNVANSHGRVFYVATNGSDQNNGESPNNAWNTIVHAYEQMRAGDLLLVAPGTYTDSNNLSGLTFSNKEGTADAPIVLRSQRQFGAILDGQLDHRRLNIIYHDYSAHHVIAGFKMVNGTEHGATIFRSHNIYYCYNEIANCGTVVPGSDGGQDGIYEDDECRGCHYIGNYIHDCGRISELTNKDHGLYLCGSGTRVYNNVLWHNCAYGLQFAAYAGISDVEVFHNVIGKNVTRSGIVLWKAPYSNIAIKNNIIADNAGVAVHFNLESTNSVTNVVSDTNIAWNNRDGVDSGAGSIDGYTSHNWIEQDPQFVKASPSALEDFMLKATSPGIDTGLVTQVIADILGHQRPDGNGPDIGAYEVSV
jgi:hypothetical protein